MPTNNKNKLLSMKRVAPRHDDIEEIDTVRSSKQFGERRAFDILMEAQYYWNQMEDFRRDRERNKRYTYGNQWDDKIKVDCEEMTEEEYIKSQGNVPLKNNLIRRLVRSVLGVYRSQSKEPTCVARDRDEQKLGETMSTILQCNMQLNRMTEVFARSMEEFLISGFIVHRKSYGWRNGKEDCWTDYVQPNNFFIDNNMRDFRGWDVSVLGEVHDISFGQLCEQFASSPSEYRKLRDIYKYASRKDYIATYAESFGYSRLQNYDFLFTSEPGRCRVIEIWRKEQKPRFRCHDYQNGDIFKIDEEDYYTSVVKPNEERLEMARKAGMPEDEVPLIKATWFVDDYWYFYYLSPFGDILKEGETPYEHNSHPYVFKAYPFIDGEVHSFVADVIDQQRYVNRLITLYDWIMRASAKGVLLMPEDCLPDGVSMEDIAESWTEFNGVIVYKPSKSGKIPQQVANNSTNIGIAELLNIQLKFFDDISGITQALQGKPGYSGESAAHYNQQTDNATKSLLDLLECFSGFVIDGAYKDVKNMQQFYDSKRVFNIAGKSGAQIIYDPKKIRDVEFDLSITESTTTPAYRHLANDILMQLWQAQAISVEQLLEHGDFPFADELLQSIKSQKEQLEQGKVPDGISPQLMQQAQQGANMEAVNKLQGAMRCAA
ncbi:MAG: portal protein [Bacteriophage sp.]|nr:MAG: portal protein [Bacteriophage sp.]